MNNKLYVGNLSYTTSEAELRQAFEGFGELRSVSVISDRMTGQPRGFGFVEYQNADDAKRAADSLNGQEMGGRRLNVNIARERSSDSRGGGGGGGRFGGGGGGGFGGGGGGGDYGGGGERSEGGSDRGGRRGGGRGNRGGGGGGGGRW